MVDRAPLLREYTLIAYRGFESLPFRQFENKTLSKKKLSFHFTSEYWDNPPRVKIFLNEQCLKDTVLSKEDHIEVTYDSDLLSEENTLLIRRYGKTSDDTQVDEHNNIVKDSVIHIHSVEINDVDLGNLIYNIPFFPAYFESYVNQQKDIGKNLPESIKPCTDLFFNGDWQLVWTEPFHIWYLENLWN